MIQDSADFNFKHVFTIIKKQPDFTEFYHFGTHLIESSINQFYVNNLDLLDRFITFFKRSIGQFKSLSKAYEQRFHANELSTPDCSKSKLYAKNKTDLIIKLKDII